MITFENATHIRIVNQENKHIIDEWNVEKVSIRKSYKKSGIVAKIFLEKQNYFITAFGKLLGKNAVGFHIPKGARPLIEICDKDNNVMASIKVEYFDCNGTLEINRIIKFEMSFMQSRE